MTTVEILLLAVALAMDAVAVSLARGMALRRPTWGQTSCSPAPSGCSRR